MPCNSGEKSTCIRKISIVMTPCTHKKDVGKVLTTGHSLSNPCAVSVSYKKEETVCRRLIIHCVVIVLGFC